MDLRFGDIGRLAAAEPVAIDFSAFVATLGAVQASSPVARAAASARRARSEASLSEAEAEGTPARAIGTRAGAFHPATAHALDLQGSATHLKAGFTSAFQPSFKPPR